MHWLDVVLVRLRLKVIPLDDTYGDYLKGNLTAEQAFRLLAKNQVAGFLRMHRTAEIVMEQRYITSDRAALPKGMYFPYVELFQRDPASVKMAILRMDSFLIRRGVIRDYV